MPVSEEYKDTLRDFYKLRARKPHLTGYTSRGDLQVYIPGGKGEEPVAGDVIRLNEYRPITNDERESQEARRYEQIREAEAAFEAARGRFRDLLERRRMQKEEAGIVADPVTEEDVVNMSKEVGVLEQIIQDRRFAVRAATEYDSFPINQLIFDNRYDEHMVEGVKAFVASPFDVATTYVRLARAGEEVGYKAERRTKRKEAAAVPAVLVPGGPGTPYEFLNPWSPSNVSFKGVLYPNAYTAIMVGMAEKLGDSLAIERIRAASSPEEATYTRDEKGVPEEEWNRAFGGILMRVTRHKFRENPLLAERLLQTGKARLVVVPLGDPLNTILGTGLQPDNPDIKNPKKWVGENLYGAALEYVRSELVEERKRSAVAAVPLGAGAGAAAAVAAVADTVMDAVTDAVSAAATAVGATPAAAAAAEPQPIRVKKKTLKTTVPVAADGAPAAAAAGAATAADMAEAVTSFLF